MALDKSIVVSVTSRLFADEIANLQSKIGCILPLRDAHRLQNIQALGLGNLCSRDSAVDFIQAYHYLDKCTLAVLEEVGPNSLRLTRIDPMDNYQIKNAYQPAFHWDNYSELVVIPPVFGRKDATVSLESNGFDVVFPAVVPEPLAQTVLQKLLLYNIYYRVAETTPTDVNLAEVTLYTTNITYMGRNYALDVDPVGSSSAMRMLDDLSIYLCVLSALIPRGCVRLLTSLVRHNKHELVEIFEGVVPPEVQALDLNNVSVADDITRMGALMTYLRSLSSIFNLGRRFHVYAFSSDTNTASCWCAYN
ncbi:ORF 26 [Macacine gammaherpesvirus 5]|nr:ORF 26 [Macacine gammaherpesvirus 5]QFN51802.1 ORF 26 [Macacine gammaherpesvirus 5]QFQ66796.1 ORF 26 [Macacine gammaherpesvirus 5]